VTVCVSEGAGLSVLAATDPATQGDKLVEFDQRLLEAIAWVRAHAGQ
jgi:hypothetical protein